MPMTRVPTRRGLPHLRKRTIFAALVAMGLIAAAGCYLYLGAIASSQLRKAVEAADRLDPKWRLMDLEEKREKVADAENSAIQIGKATSLLPTGWPPVRKLLG